MVNHNPVAPVEETYLSSVMAEAPLDDGAPADASYSIDQLIQRGKQRGSLAQSDVMQFVLQHEDNPDYLEAVYEALNKANIVIVDDLEDQTAGDVDVDIAMVEAVLERDAATVGDTVRTYLSDIGRVPLLTADQEARLAQQIEQGEQARVRLGKLKDLHGPEALELQRAIRTAQEAREFLAISNLRLVVSVAKKYMNRGLSLMDLVQEGSMGLLRAVEKFDYHKGFKFSTYATWWIRQSITRAIADQARTIRIPVHMVETINRLQRTSRHLAQELDREPTMMELALEARVSTILSDEQRLRYQLQSAYVDDRCPLYDPQLVQALRTAAERVEKILASNACDQPAYERVRETQAYLQQVLRRAPTAAEIALECHVPEVLSESFRIRLQTMPAVIHTQSRTYNSVLHQLLERAANKVRDIHKAALEPVSLEMPVGQEDESSLGDFIEDSKIEAPSDAAANQMRREAIAQVLSSLPERERLVIKLRYGLHLSGEECREITSMPAWKTYGAGIDLGRYNTLEDVGKLFDVTRERIRQIEVKALRKLRHPKYGKKLRDYLD
jgi:RNA polymerase primary sigma factor